MVSNCQQWKNKSNENFELTLCGKKGTGGGELTPECHNPAPLRALNRSTP